MTSLHEAPTTGQYAAPGLTCPAWCSGKHAIDFECGERFALHVTEVSVTVSDGTRVSAEITQMSFSPTPAFSLLINDGETVPGGMSLEVAAAAAAVLTTAVTLVSGAEVA